jgi:hypothetical protein
MPKVFTDCVKALTKQGKSADSAYAICVSSYMKKYGKSPFKNESELVEEELPSEVKKVMEGLVTNISVRNIRLSIAALEGIADGKKVKIVNDIV